MTDPLGQSQVLPYLVGLAKKGHKITILSCEKNNRYHHYANIITNITNTADIKWVYLPYTSKPKVLSTIIDIYKINKTAINLFDSEKFDIVHCRSYIPAIIGLKLKRKRNVKFIFDMRGFWADERIDGGIWNIKNPVFYLIYRFFKKKELQFLKESDTIVCLTHKAKTEILSWKIFTDKSVNIEVIPCCCDTDLFNPSYAVLEKKLETRKQLNIKDDSLVLSYLGSVGTWYMLPEMLKFFKKLSDKYPNSIFFFITPDSPEIIYKEAKSLNITDDKLLIKTVPRNEVPLMLGAADISIFFIKPAYSKIASSPTKQAEVMSMGQPIICNAGIGDTDFIIEKSGAGIVVKDFSNKELDKAINCIDKILKISHKTIREYAINHFDVNNGIAKYDFIYQKLMKS